MHSLYKEIKAMQQTQRPKQQYPQAKVMMIPARSRTGANYYSSPENLIKHLCSNSLSSGGSSGKGSFRSTVSPPSEKTPVKVVGEDVLFMDGVLVASDAKFVGSGPSSSPESVIILYE
ncbi:hypothetical protein V6N13_106288 [Hibiscus sabdariffa]|uniref:Uncharacterized protein n=1 Tax=Hibiscus sabdariffa TaxID=183260 RepID=A0ABR2F0A0_9ROSI